MSLARLAVKHTNKTRTRGAGKDGDIRGVEYGTLGGGADEQSEGADIAKGADMLTEYIPAETVTLYVAGVSASQALSEATGGAITIQTLYYFFLIATPAILIFIAYGLHRKSGQGEKFKLPIWGMFAGFMAFGVWALAVPGLLDGNASQGVLAGFGALLVSTFLGLIERTLGIYRPK